MVIFKWNTKSKPFNSDCFVAISKGGIQIVSVGNKKYENLQHIDLLLNPIHHMVFNVIPVISRNTVLYISTSL